MKQHQREFFRKSKQAMDHCLTHQACSLSDSHTGSALPNTDTHMRIKDSDGPRVDRRRHSAATSHNIGWFEGVGEAVGICQSRLSWTGSAETENEHLAQFVAWTATCQTQRWGEGTEEEVPTGLITIHFQLSALIVEMICHVLVGLKQKARWLNKEGIDCTGHHGSNCQETSHNCRWFT